MTNDRTEIVEEGTNIKDKIEGNPHNAGVTESHGFYLKIYTARQNASKFNLTVSILTHNHT